MAELNLGHVVGPGVPTGGTSGQVLKKNSATNFDTSWSANDATTIPMSSSDSTSINEAISNYISSGVCKQITSGSANDIKTPGRYYVYQSVTDKPVTRAGYCDVYAYDSSWVKQVYYTENTNRVYMRTCINNAWNNWEELVSIIETASLANVADFETYLNKTIKNASFTVGGTAMADLPFATNANIIVTGDNSNMHVMCYRANGEMYVRSKTSGTWEASWQQLALKSDIAKHSVTVASANNKWNGNTVYANDDLLFFDNYLSSTQPSATPIQVATIAQGDRPSSERQIVCPVASSGAYAGFAILSFTADGKITLEYMSVQGNVVIRTTVSK